MHAHWREQLASGEDSIDEHAKLAINASIAAYLTVASQRQAIVTIIDGSIENATSYKL